MSMVRLSKFACVLAVLTSALWAQDDPAITAALEKARKAKEAGRPEDVLSTLEEHYGKLASHAEANLLLAEATVALSLYDRALTYAAKAVDLNKDHFQAQKLAASAFFGRAEEVRAEPGVSASKVEALYEECATFAQGALKLNGKDAETWALLGEAQFWLSQGKESAESYLKAVESSPEPKNESWLYFAARGRKLAGDAKGAVELMDEAAKVKPGEAWIHRERAKFLTGSGMEDEANLVAQGYFKALIAENLDDQTRREAPRGIQMALGTANPAESRRLMEAWAKAKPNEKFAHWWAGYYAENLKDDAAAFQHFSKSFEVSGGRQADAALRAADAQMRQIFASGKGTDVKALASPGEWILKGGRVEGYRFNDRRKDPASRGLELARPLVEAGSFEEAAKVLETYALPVAGSDFRILDALGFLWRDTGGPHGTRGSKAKEAWTRSRDFYVKASEAVLNDPASTPREKAATLNDTGLMFHYHFDQIEKGVEYYRKALSFDAEFKDALENMGICMEKVGKHEEAVSFYERVLKLEPGRRVSAAGLARARKELGR